MTRQELNNLSLEELRQLNSDVVRTIEAKKREMASEIKNRLRVGDIVTVDHPRLHGCELVVTRVKRTNVIVSMPNDPKASFDVPMSMIEAQ